MSAGNPDQKVYVYAVFFFPDLRLGDSEGSEARLLNGSRLGVN